MSEAAQLAQQHANAFNDRAWSRASALYAPDLVLTEPAGTTHGIESLLARAQGFTTALPDSRLDAKPIVESGSRVVVEGVYSGTHTGPLTTPQGEVPPTGRRLSLPYCEVFEVAAGRITQIRTYYDQMAFAAQLGLLPEPTAH